MLSAIAGTAKGEYETAIESMKRATALEEQMSPPSGPPETIKPTHELFGEILLKAGKPQEAAKQFATALLRQPNRSRSLLGAARAAAQMGDKAGALLAYSDLLRVWQQADAQLPDLREARDYVAQTKAQ
jgi:predicted Zn-dependent protease